MRIGCAHDPFAHPMLHRGDNQIGVEVAEAGALRLLQ